MNPNPSCSKNRKLKEKEKKGKLKMKRENKIKSTINDLDRLVRNMDRPQKLGIFYEGPKVESEAGKMVTVLVKI